MKAISIRQPWAGSVVLGWKPVENRSQMFQHRGQFLIHAGLRVADDFNAADRTILDNAHHAVPLLDDPRSGTAWAMGAIVGVAEIRAAHRGCDGSCAPGWAIPGQVHHMVTAIGALRYPVPCPGRLGIWTPDEDVLAQVKEAWPQ